MDEKKLPFNVAVELSYLKHEEQEKVQEIMDRIKMIPSLEQAKRLKSCSKEGEFSQTLIDLILLPNQEDSKPFSMKMDYRKYFPKGMSKSEMTDIMTKLLEEWSETRDK